MTAQRFWTLANVSMAGAVSLLFAVSAFGLFLKATVRILWVSKRVNIELDTITHLFLPLVLGLGVGALVLISVLCGHYAWRQSEKLKDGKVVPFG